MSSNFIWLAVAGLSGTALQFLWLDLFSAMDSQSLAVVIVTGVVGFLMARALILRTRTNLAALVIVCVVSCALVALVAFVVGSLLERPDAVLNSIFQRPLVFFALNAGGLGGWLVGAFYGLALAAIRRKRI